MDPKTRQRLSRQEIYRSKRERRRTINLLSSGISQKTIQLYREAFNMIDQDGDGNISKEDLRCMLRSLGTPVTDEVLTNMLNQWPGSLNFTAFLTMFADKTAELESHEVIKNALSLLDEDRNGFIDAQKFSDKLSTVGYKRYNQEEISTLTREAPVDVNGMLDLKTFAKILSFDDDHI